MGHRQDEAQTRPALWLGNVDARAYRAGGYRSHAERHRANAVRRFDRRMGRIAAGRGHLLSIRRPISPDNAVARATWGHEPLRSNVEETAEGSSSRALPVGL